MVEFGADLQIALGLFDSVVARVARVIVFETILDDSMTSGNVFGMSVNILTLFINYKSYISLHYT